MFFNKIYIFNLNAEMTAFFVVVANNEKFTTQYKDLNKYVKT